LIVGCAYADTEDLMDVMQANRRVIVQFRATDSYPFFADHQAKIERVIPVVVLERAWADPLIPPGPPSPSPRWIAIQ
jgi:uncharacterized protein YbbC (DUF1343 family)